MEAKGVDESIELNCNIFDSAKNTEAAIEAIQNQSNKLDDSPVVEDIPIDEKREQVNHLSVDTMLDENCPSPLSSGVNEPMECSSINSQISPKEATKLVADDVVMEDSANDINVSVICYLLKNKFTIF